MKQELYHWLYQMDLHRDHFSNDDALKTVMLNTVKFYEMVHANGAHLVGPVNLHELLIDPENGHFEVKAGGDRDALMQDVDSVKFMPPEILSMKSRWCLDADKFVLAELLFTFLSSIPYEYNKDSIIGITFDNERHTVAKSTAKHDFEKINFQSSVNPRGIVRFADYEKEVLRFADNIVYLFGVNRYISVLVLGTEEFMYPTFRVGEMIKKKGIADNVWIHSTTRSPIIASGEAGYPLYHRYQIRSLYDANRTTFIYNLEQYDKVIILTDSLKDTDGLFDLWNVLKSVGNHDIAIAKWIYNK